MDDAVLTVVLLVGFVALAVVGEVIAMGIEAMWRRRW